VTAVETTPTEAADGSVGLPFTMPVELGKVREFLASTMGDVDAWITDPQCHIPPTFLASARLWQGPGEAVNPQSADTSRLLHAGQEYVFHGPPPRVGTTLSGQARISRVYRKRGRRGGEMTFTEVTTEFTDESGRLVATAVTTTVITEQTSEGDR